MQAHANSSDPGVRTFAQTMVNDHGAANAELLAVAKQLNVSLDQAATRMPAAQAMSDSA